ncbi:MAG: hypothetical protein HQM03_19730 [Magnetococcales bacterium]|nr:hypothetical protein [Magnetococcales bacterium]
MNEEEKQRLEAQVRELRELLRRIPHSLGDHTDLCRMANDGLPPRENERCRCHVAPILQALKESH